jgi:hypothetical protein
MIPTLALAGRTTGKGKRGRQPFLDQAPLQFGTLLRPPYSRIDTETSLGNLDIGGNGKAAVQARARQRHRPATLHRLGNCLERDPQTGKA